MRQPHIGECSIVFNCEVESARSKYETSLFENTNEHLISLRDPVKIRETRSN